MTPADDMPSPSLENQNEMVRADVASKDIMGGSENERHEIQQCPPLQNEMINAAEQSSDSSPEDFEDGPTDDETQNFALPGVSNVPIPQFFMRLKGKSHACNISLTATMVELMDIASQVREAPRNQIKLQLSVATSQNISSAVELVIEFGFSPGCTIDISILGPGGSSVESYKGSW